MLARLSRESRRFYLWVATAVLLGTALRLAYAIHYKWHQRVWGDAAYFFYQAQLLAKGHIFVDPWRYHLLHQGYWSGAEHPPLYTVFLAIPNVLGFHTFHEAAIATIILGSITVGVIALVGREIAGPRVGIVAAFLAAIYAQLWFSDVLVMSETLTVLLIALVVLYGYRFWKQPSWFNAACFGLLCGLAALSRAELVLLFPLVALPLTLRARNLDWKPRLERFGVMVVLAALPVMPWVAYNLSRFDHPVFLSTGADFTLANTNCDYTYYGGRVGWWDARCLQNRYLVKGDESDQAQHFRTQALDYIDSHKSRLPVVLAARVGRMWDLYRPFQKLPWDAFEQGRGPLKVTKFALGEYYAFVLLAIAGLVLLRRRKTIIYPIVGLAVIATIAGMAAFGSTRYRLPAEVTIVLGAAVAIGALLDRWWPSRAPAEPDREHTEPLAAASIGGNGASERVGDVVGARSGS